MFTLDQYDRMEAGQVVSHDGRLISRVEDLPQPDPEAEADRLEAQAEQHLQKAQWLRAEAEAQQAAEQAQFIS